MTEFAWDSSLDGWIIVVGALCAVASALLGNFLVLRRMSMLGDAVTHAVLPGIAAAFFISSSRSSLPMFIGAVVVGVLTAVFTEWIRNVGKVDEGASMGVVFTSLFALGLVMLVQVADDVDLDPNCVLYGALEMTPLDLVPILGFFVPRAALILAVVTLLNLTFVVLFFKELKISSFDPALATTMGFSARWMHYALMVLVSITAVASFESVGSILVVAMFVVPAAAAYMLTDRLATMVGLSVVLAIASSVGGHLAAITVPRFFGFGSTTTAGMMAVVSGGLFVLAALLGPSHGVLVKWVRRQRLSWQILCDDIVALLYRVEEKPNQVITLDDLADQLLTSPWSLNTALRMLRRKGEISADGSLHLTPKGHDRGRELVRSHRLWEQYLVVETSAEADRIHPQAEQFEHFTDRTLRDRLDDHTEAPTEDPHGSPIPHEKDSP
ncbi:Manganese transport system membrane protein MntB [Rubripirellula amarantea]|uniref:Manganese transport system membrane protein MntB n=1 Tax=Rubripirellula amarantea TaxID=2527999 RepID=A0A5C5WW52_9BACT|nr:metal ABC transporter permease [Rubripirellula amarantea]TWT54082.1 Manganese transport system membrane protein MntB [Rubripirellula amarantea]